ncbi:MAG: f420-dependent oxidoreductase, partial [Mycobacterium sp.]|nr:f420-dependent oxidoreductase [Mycobacterium sp.]
ADGWLAIFPSAQYLPEQLAHIAAGREKVGKTLDGFDVVPTVPVVVGDDVAACADPVRAYAALYIGGMGSREKNFYNQLAARMGYEAEAAEIQDRFLGKQYREAAAAVPFEFIDQTSLLGPVDRIAEGLQRYAGAGVTTLSVATYAGTLEERVATLRTMVEALDKSGVGE